MANITILTDAEGSVSSSNIEAGAVTLAKLGTDVVDEDGKILDANLSANIPVMADGKVDNDNLNGFLVQNIELSGINTATFPGVYCVGYTSIYFVHLIDSTHYIQYHYDTASGVFLKRTGERSGSMAIWGQWSNLLVVNGTKTATSTGTAGQISYDSNYFYVCTATNTWIRFAKTAW